MQTVFYSWQSDLPNSTNRGFIQNCLEKAIKELRAEGAVHVDPSPDRDTQGVSGSPDIAETIFDKIDEADAFVCDASLINGCYPNPPKVTCDCTRPTPNPNVLCEWGRATKSVGFERIITVFNEATGRIEDLPFDLRKRLVVTYRLGEGDDKEAQKKTLTGKIKFALKSVLDLPRTAIALEFGDPQQEKCLGSKLELRAVFHEPIVPDQIPIYKKESGFGKFDDAIAAIQNSQLNATYYKDKAQFLVATRLMRPVGLVIRNAGSQLLRNVRLTATCMREVGDGLLISHACDMPTLSPRIREFYTETVRADHLRTIQLTRSSLAVKPFPDRFKIEISFGDVQAKAVAFSEEFFVGSVISRKIEVSGLLYADELASPEETTLSLIFETDHKKMTMDDLRNELPEEVKSR